MTHEQRNTAIINLLKSYTAKHTVSKTAARKSLIKGGIYTAKGKLRAEYGGESKEAEA